MGFPEIALKHWIPILARKVQLGLYYQRANQVQSPLWYPVYLCLSTKACTTTKGITFWHIGYFLALLHSNDESLKIFGRGYSD